LEIEINEGTTKNIEREMRKKWRVVLGIERKEIKERRENEILRGKERGEGKMEANFGNRKKGGKSEKVRGGGKS